MPDFLINALWASLGVALLAGPIGCLMVFNRVACLGDTLAHGAILGLSLGLMMHMEPMLTLAVVTVAWVGLLGFLNKDGTVSTDSAMAFLTHSSLAVSIVLFTFVPVGAPNLMEAFIGNILTVGREDIFLIYAMDAVFGVILLWGWKKWILIAVHPDLAAARNMNVPFLRMLFLMMIGLFIAFSIKMMGALLVPAFLIIPALAARPFAKTPEQMAFGAGLLAVLSAVAGLFASYEWDTPSGPMMVCTAVAFYGVLMVFKQMLRIKRLSCFKRKQKETS